jgi:hypothetical protein
MQYPFTLHTFRPTETIDAVIRLKGRHSLTHNELAHMRVIFNELNGRVVPRPGMTYKIPLPMEVTDDYGNVIDLPKPELPVDESINALIDSPDESIIVAPPPVVEAPKAEDPPKRVRVKPVLQVFT